MSREVTFYTRRQCGLCDETAAELRALGRDLSFAITELDIDADPALREQYNDIVPVVAIGERIIAHAPIAPGALRTALESALA